MNHSISLERILIQKKATFLEIPLKRKLENKLIFRSEIGNLCFSFENSILSFWMEDFFNRDDVPIDFISLEIKLDLKNPPVSFFSNGYNNWTLSREIPVTEKFKNVSRLIRWLLYPFGEYLITKDIRNFSKSSLRSFFYTYLRDNNQNLLFMGSLNEKEFYTLFRYEPEASKMIITKDLKNFNINSNLKIIRLFIEESDYYSVFEKFSNLLDKSPIQQDFVSGYTTWYYHYNNISFDQIVKRIEFFGQNQIPIDYFQIDDGYQKRVGDWLELKPDFHNQMKELVNRIHKYNIRAGLWIAPFICEKKSYIFQYHPEWILKDHKGNLVVAGFNPLWSGKFYALNIYHPDFREYLKMVFSRITENWGFDLLKLDFLYAACLYPVKRKARAQQMQDAMNLIHEFTNWKNSKINLLGCGIPFSHSFGNVDYTRVSSDVEEKWENYLSIFHFLERVSTYSAINSTIFRHPFNQKNFLNDPDVYFLRKNYKFLKLTDLKKNIKLTEDEKLTLFYVNHIFGGLIFTSDPVEEYDDLTLNLYKKTFPYFKKKFINFFYKDKDVYEFHFVLQKQVYYKDIIKKGKEEKFILEYRFFLNISEKNYQFELNENEIYFRVSIFFEYFRKKLSV